jgi:hypothetical protein
MVRRICLGRVGEKRAKYEGKRMKDKWQVLFHLFSDLLPTFDLQYSTYKKIPIGERGGTSKSSALDFASIIEYN